MLIRDFTPGDMGFVSDIISEHWGEEIAAKARMEMREMHNSVQHWPPHYYVAEIDGQVVGCGGYRSAWIMSNTYELIWVNVKKGFHGQGIGRALTQKRIDRIKELGGSLILLMTQSKQRFFEDFGFHRCDMFWGGSSTNCHFNDPWKLMSLQIGPVDIAGDK